MGNLFDELKKAKLIDKKRAKQIAHEQRVEHKQGGGDLARDADLERKAKDYEQRKEQERAQHRETAKERRAHQRDKERRAEVRQHVASRQLGNEATGGRRWHFKSPTGTLPFLPVNEMTAKRLEGGEYAIVRDPNVSWPRFVIVPREVAIALREIDASAVCYVAGR